MKCYAKKQTEWKETSRYTYACLSNPTSTVTPYTLSDFSAVRCEVVTHHQANAE